MLPIPDLLHPRPYASVDEALLEELLELSFLGSEGGPRLGSVLDEVALPESTWREDFFAEGLFLDELIEECFSLSAAGRDFPLHLRYLRRVLVQPPMDAETLRYRQAILRELESDPETLRRAAALHRHLFDLLALFKTPSAQARLDLAALRLDALRQAKRVVDSMAADFAGCASGLRRLHEVGEEIRASREYSILASLLDHEEHLSELTLRVRVGADGRIRRLRLEDLSDNSENPFHESPLRHWWGRLRIAWRGLDLDRREVVNRLILAVYREISPALRTVLQVLGPLELYLGAVAYAERTREMGLGVCLAEVAGDGEASAAPLRLEGLHNPLLLRQGIVPKPCDVAPRCAHPTVVVTGPNSGGKTRMLQAVGIAQLFGQSGLFVAARRARLPLVPGLFVSLVEQATADQTEGRLGSELTRIRQLFEEIRPGAMILLDELCSGTNPSEAVEIVSLVLDLLRGIDPVAFLTTHFLDYTQELAADPPYPQLEFLHAVTTADHVPTYTFRDGVASTSLAADTARRMGVTFDDLADLLARRFDLPVRPRQRIEDTDLT
jgi:DNA mismatch repair protein MutS2